MDRDSTEEIRARQIATLQDLRRTCVQLNARSRIKRIDAALARLGAKPIEDEGDAPTLDISPLGAEDASQRHPWRRRNRH